MGMIIKTLTLYGRHGKKRVTALFDTGSSKSLVRKSLAATLGSLTDLPEPERFEMARGTFTVRQGFVGSVAIRGARLAHLLRAVEDLSEDLILGADFLQQWDVHLHPRRKTISIDPRALRLKAVGHRQA